MLYLNILLLKQEMLRHLGLLYRNSSKIISWQTQSSGTELIHIHLRESLAVMRIHGELTDLQQSYKTSAY